MKNVAVPKLNKGLPTTRGRRSPPPSACHRLMKDSVVLTSSQECSHEPAHWVIALPRVECARAPVTCTNFTSTLPLFYSLTLSRQSMSAGAGSVWRNQWTSVLPLLPLCLSCLFLPPAGSEHHQLPALTLERTWGKANDFFSFVIKRQSPHAEIQNDTFWVLCDLRKSR